MTYNSPVRDRHHMCIVEPVRATKFGEVGDRGHWITPRIHEAVVAFDIAAGAYAVFMCPSLV